MRRPTGTFTRLAAFAAALALVGAPAALADEKPKKDPKDVQTGKQMHVMFTRQMGVHNDLELQEYVQRVGEKLAAVSERPDLDWHFTIIDTDDVNAFATMGGYVYISRGILPYFQDEADLAAVLGHEIGHITAEHLKKQNRKGMISGLASAATAIAIRFAHLKNSGTIILTSLTTGQLSVSYSYLSAFSWFSGIPVSSRVSSTMSSSAGPCCWLPLAWL
jgi:predicted Zn-dependent protease